MKPTELLQTKLEGISLPHSFKMSADEEAKKAGISITLHGTFVFDGMTIKDMAEDAVRNGTIKFVAANRPNYSSFKDGQKVTILMTGAGRKLVDHEAATSAKFAGSDPEGKRAILAKVMGIEPDEVPDELIK